MKIEEIEVGGFYVAGRAYYPYFAKVLAVTPNAGSGLCLVQVVGATFMTCNTSPETLTERVTENLDLLEELCALAKANAQRQGPVHADDLGAHPARPASTAGTAQQIVEKAVAK